MDRRQFLSSLTLAAPGVDANAKASSVPEVQLITAHMPPYVRLEKGVASGAMVDLVQTLCRRIPVTSEMDTASWPSAVTAAASRRRTCVFPLTRLVARETQFRWLAPLFSEEFVFAALHDSKFNLKQPLGMRQKRVAIVRGAAQRLILPELGFDTVVIADTVDEVRALLQAGKADAAFGERQIVRMTLQRWGWADLASVSPTVRKSTSWLAGSLDFTESDIRAFNLEIQRMNADGSVRAILQANGLEMDQETLSIRAAGD